MIRSPYLVSRAERPVRYIKYELGFPSVNTRFNAYWYGSGIYRVYAIGSENEFRPLDEDETGRSFPSMPTREITSSRNSPGSKTVFDADGVMIAEKERSGRTINYEYNGERLIKINYPENVYMEFIYGASGKLEKVSATPAAGKRSSPWMRTATCSEVVYPDDEKRQFSYDERGLLTIDKKGNAEKKYTWDDGYAVLTEVETAQRRQEDAGSLGLEECAQRQGKARPGSRSIFPASAVAMESTVTFEDGRVEKHVTGSGWNWKYDERQIGRKSDLCAT